MYDFNCYPMAWEWYASLCHDRIEVLQYAQQVWLA